MIRYFRKSMTAQLLGGIVAFGVLFPGVEAAFADDFLQRQLQVSVDTENPQAFDKLITQFQEQYGDDIEVISRNPPPYDFPYFEIRVEQGLEDVWIPILEQTSPLVEEVVRVEDSEVRLPTETDKQAYVFLITGDNKALKNIGQFLTVAYQDKCGDCVQPYPLFSHYQKFSIAYLSQEVIPDENLVEALEIRVVMVNEEKKAFNIIVSGKYASAYWKDKKVVPPGAFQDMALQYPQQLKEYTDKIKGQLEAYR